MKSMTLIFAALIIFPTIISTLIFSTLTLGKRKTMKMGGSLVVALPKTWTNNQPADELQYVAFEMNDAKELIVKPSKNEEPQAMEAPSQPTNDENEIKEE